jgi:hypothetical protein
MDDLQRRLTGAEIGLAAPLSVIRQNTLLELTIQPAEMPGGSG